MRQVRIRRLGDRTGLLECFHEIGERADGVIDAAFHAAVQEVCGLVIDCQLRRFLHGLRCRRGRCKTATTAGATTSAAAVCGITTTATAAAPTFTAASSGSGNQTAGIRSGRSLRGFCTGAATGSAALTAASLRSRIRRRNAAHYYLVLFEQIDHRIEMTLFL